MASFGEYITNEYALLRQILSYLSLNDLLAARRVCKRWHKCSTRMLMNFDKVPQLYYTDRFSREDEELMHWRKTKIIPSLLLRFSVKGDGFQKEDSPDMDIRNSCWKNLFVTKESRLPEEDALRMLDKESGFETPRLIHFLCEGPIGIVPGRRNRGKEYVFSTGASTSSVIVFPKMPGVTYNLINLFVCNKMQKLDVDQLLGSEPVKCLLLFDNSTKNSSYTKMEKLMKLIVGTLHERQGHTFAFGGGKLDDITLWTRANDTVKSCVLGLLIRGENVTAHSAIMKNLWSEQEVDEYIKDFAGQVGPLPEGAVRIAIMMQCVDRPRILGTILSTSFRMDNKEAGIFARHFPNVPICGFLAGGEYGTCSDSTGAGESVPPRPKKRKDKLKMRSCIHFQTTSFVVLTFCQNSSV